MLEHQVDSDHDISRKVYVVCGRDATARDDMYEYLETLGLESIKKELAVDLTGEGAPFVGRIIDRALENAQAIIVLLTGDDVARLREAFWEDNEEGYEKEFWPQPRQEQIFEAGYAFGRSPKRTILVQVGRIRPFSDIAGRYISNFTEAMADREELKNRLRRAGCKLKDSEQIKIEQEENEERPVDPKKVFVVYGRDKAVRREVFAFLRGINLSPIPWNQAVRLTGAGSPFIGEVVEAALSEAQAVVVLLTGDDEARLRRKYFTKGDSRDEKDLASQPRPNVLFEAGMAFSRLEDRTILVELGKLRLCNVLSSRHRIRLSNKLEHRLEFAHSLENAGCVVTLPQNELLRRIGNFNFTYE